MKPRFQVYRDRRDKWRWRLIARNGEIVAGSQGYATKANAKRGALAMMRSAVEATWTMVRANGT